MKSIVIYDSYTGNTKKIAQAIHKGMSQVGNQCDIVRLREVDLPSLASYDLIGLGSPVFHFRELANVTIFVEYDLENLDGKHAFSFCTGAGTMGHYLSRVVSAMTQRGLTVLGWAHWYGGSIYPFLPKPYPTDGHPDEIDLKEAENFGIEMVIRSKRISLGETQLIPTFPKGQDYDKIWGPSFRMIIEGENNKQLYKAQSFGFHVNTKKCGYPKCTHCIDNCPMGAIDFSESPPLFTIACDMCWHCEQTCPRGAIEVNWEPFERFSDREQLAMIDEMKEAFDTAEATGRLRRLLPPEEIGWDTPYYLYKKQHPRYKLDR